MLWVRKLNKSRVAADLINHLRQPIFIFYQRTRARCIKCTVTLSIINRLNICARGFNIEAGEPKGAASTQKHRLKISLCPARLQRGFMIITIILAVGKAVKVTVEIELLESSGVKIRLTREDLERLNISLEELDCANAETRRIIHTLLDAARCEFKLDINPSERMMIEVMPNRNGGCSIYITGLEERMCKAVRLSSRKSMKPQFFDFDGADSLMSATYALRSFINSGNQFSELYRMEPGGYRLLVYPDSEVSAGVWAVLSEYCRSRGDGNAAAAFTREHGRLLAGGNAIGKLCGYCGG